MAEKGEHQEGSGPARAQRAPHHVQRGAHGPGGDRAQRAGPAGEEEAQAGAPAAQVPEQAAVRGFIPHAGLGQ